MNVFETLPYLVKVNLYWVLFYACHWLLFRKHTFFKWNRFYLICTLLISWALPVIKLPAAQTDKIVVTISENAHSSIDANQAVPLNQTIIVTDPSTIVDWSQILTAIYLIGFGLMAFQLLKGLNNIRKVIDKNTVIHFEEYSLVLLDNELDIEKQKDYRIGSFSFFKWLFLTKDDYEHHLETILNHELVHIKQRHSLDILFVELLKVVFWFNPVLWLYKNAIQEVHEFLADEEIPNRNAYSNFLVSYALNAPVQSLTNHFFNSRLLKIRIHMIYKHRTSRWLLSKYSIIVPVAFLAVFLTAARERVDVEDKTLKATTTSPSVSNQETNKPDLEQLVSPTIPPTEQKTQSKINITEGISVKGQVVDKEGLPIVDAIIVVENSNLGVATDEGGLFQLKDIPSNSVLVASHINYISQELPLEKGKTEYSFTLGTKPNELEKIVVVAFAPVQTNNSDKKGWTVVEKEPEFPGGKEAMYRYLARKTLYPTAASSKNVQGTVFVSFTVKKDGTIDNPKVIKGIGFGCDEEATRNVLGMPKWSPAIQNGKPVETRFTIPIEFQIEKNKTNNDKRQGSLANPDQAPNIGIPTLATTIPAFSGDPLIILNGVAMQQRGTVGLAQINKTNITSINVLRGASATSIYGMEGVNGVVTVTTREAKTPATFSNYRYNTGKIIQE